MRSAGLWLVMSVAWSAVAQPVVPAGFLSTQVAPLLDGTIPQLATINSPSLGFGVVTASSSQGVTTFRIIEPTGVIRGLSTFVDARVDRVQRVRFDADGILSGVLHATLIDSGANMNPQGGNTTIYVTIDSDASVSTRWEIGGSGDQRAYDFVLVADAGDGQPGAILLDGDGSNGTSLALMSDEFVVTVVDADSNPTGRTDTDVWGFQVDRTGLYGGGVLLTDSDTDDNVTALYELFDVDALDPYRLIGVTSTTSQRFYGDLDIADSGPFGGVVYVTEQISDQIQQVAPDGTHTTWATGFVGIDSLSISPDGESMYVADLNGVWLIRPEGNEPGPVLVAYDPSTPSGNAIAGPPITSARLIFSEPVSFTDGDVMITDGAGGSVAFDASGSGSQFMIIGFAEPLESDTYTITVADSLTAVATGQALDGDNDGVAGGVAQVVLTHRCDADPAEPYGLLDLSDVTRFVERFVYDCD